MPRIALVAALARNGTIGAGNALPWRLAEDLRHFKALTLGHPIVMGRRTFESIGRPLPGRRNLVVSRNRAFAAAGCEVHASLQGAIAACGAADVLFVIGGAQVYAQALPLARCLHLTEIDADFPGDVRFPEFDRREWIESSRERHRAEAGFDFDFVTYRRN